MATSININGKTITRPGVYTTIKSGIKNATSNLSTGNIVLIDDGIGASWGGGAGVGGELSQGGDSIYEFTSIGQMREFVKGGELWNLAKPLFKPAENGILGAAKVFYIRAAKTKAAKIDLTFENGAISFKTLDEGLCANGVLTGTALSKGYAAKFVAAPSDPTKYVAQFFVGDFKGIDPLNNVPYDNIREEDSKPILLLSSKPCETVQELIDWCNRSNAFKELFVVDTATATGAFSEADLTANAGFNLAAGGTETFDSESFDAALEAIKDVDNTFFLALQYGVDKAVGLNNTKLFDYLQNDSKYEKFMVVGAGYDKEEFAGAENSSEAVAKYYDSDKVIAVHGGAKDTSREGFLLRSQLYKAAAVLGRICGLDPQTPATFKSIGIDGEIHVLNDAELEKALDVGLLVTYYDSELNYFVILQGINTLQKNEFLINEDSTSSNIALKRIQAALNKEVAVRGKRRFFGNPTAGANRNTVSPETIELWLRGLLQSKVATTNTDNLLLSFGNISSSSKEDVMNVEYEFVGNTEITKIIVTGTIIAD